VKRSAQAFLANEKYVKRRIRMATQKGDLNELRQSIRRKPLQPNGYKKNLFDENGKHFYRLSY
jgi:hypothetical protein